MIMRIGLVYQNWNKYITIDIDLVSFCAVSILLTIYNFETTNTAN